MVELAGVCPAELLLGLQGAELLPLALRLVSGAGAEHPPRAVAADRVHPFGGGAVALLQVVRLSALDRGPASGWRVPGRAGAGLQRVELLPLALHLVDRWAWPARAGGGTRPSCCGPSCWPVATRPSCRRSVSALPLPAIAAAGPELNQVKLLQAVELLATRPSCCRLSRCGPVVTRPSCCWFCTRSCAWSSRCARSRPSRCTRSTAAPCQGEPPRAVALRAGGHQAAELLHLVDRCAWPSCCRPPGRRRAAGRWAPGGRAAALDRGGVAAPGRALRLATLLQAVELLASGHQ